MYPLSYFVLFYIVALFIFIIVFLILFICGVFNKQDSEPAVPKNTIDFLLEQVIGSNEDKEILDSVMREFYSHYYTIYKGAEYFYSWLKLIQNITLLDYMSVEQAAKFRDELIRKNPSVKKEIEQAIGESLKYRENNKKKKG